MTITGVEFAILALNNRFTDVYMSMSSNGQVHLPMDEKVYDLPKKSYNKRFLVKHLMHCTLRTGTTQKAYWMEKMSNHQIIKLFNKLT